MTQRDRNRQEQERSERARNRASNRDQQDDDWAEQVPWTHERNPYGDYGWERQQSALPEFRDPDIHVQPYEREEVSRYRNIRWNRQYDYGVEEGPFTGVGPKGYQRSDERIFEDVCERLTQHGQIDASDIEVSVKNGEVTLSGSIEDRYTKRMAEDLVDDVRGVKDVHNDLKVLHPGQYQHHRRSGRDQSGLPGGGRGRVDRVGRSGVYPASGPWPEGNAPVQGEESWGQGERGAEGYEDSGRSEIHMPPEDEA